VFAFSTNIYQCNCLIQNNFINSYFIGHIATISIIETTPI
jgi:hypothetical protein